MYANSRMAEIVANKGRATAFLRVNRPVEYPLDLNGILPPITRTLGMINVADSQLALARDKIKYVQFWFLKMTPIDDVAFNRLLEGNINEAISIWKVQDNLSSMQNRMLCFLIREDLAQGIALAEQLYVKFGNEYCEKIDSATTLRLSRLDLVHQFAKSLGEEFGMISLARYVVNREWKEFVCGQAVIPILGEIQKKIREAKGVNHQDADARMKAAQDLIINTKEPFTQLKTLLMSEDPQFQMKADELGLEILQCGIDYFNHSDDANAAREVMWILKYASSIVVGAVAKQRCEENVKILQTIIDKLPPKEVMAEYKAVKTELAEFVNSSCKISDAVTLLNNTKPHLQSIKRKLGATNAYYLKLSTQIVGNALHNIVEEVNAVQYEFASSSLDKIKSTVQEAWEATTIMDDFDLEPSYRPHYNENRNTLKSIKRNLNIPTSKPSNKPECIEEDYEYGETLWELIKSPKSSKWEAATIMTVLGGLVGYLIYYNNPEMIAVDEKLSYILRGMGIGAVSWLCIFVDNDDKHVDTSIFGNGGCIGVLLLIGLFIFYWLYKIIRLAIDGIKGV